MSDEAKLRALFWGGLAALLVLGCWLLWEGYLKWDSTSWPTTQATVTRAWGGQSNYPRKAFIEAEYSYEVEGQRHEGSGECHHLLAFHPITREEAIKAAKTFEGKTIEVHYRPTAPGTSCTRPGLAWSDMLLPTVFFLLTGGLWFGLCLSLQRDWFGSEPVEMLGPDETHHPDEW